MITGRSFSSGTTAELNADGDWVVVSYVEEKLRVNDGEWLTEKVAAQCTNKSLQDAYSVATQSVVAQLNDALKKSEIGSMFPVTVEGELLSDDPAAELKAQ